MAYIIIIFLVVLNLAINYGLQSLPKEMSSVNILLILLVISHFTSLVILVTTFFHWLYVRKSITRKSKIEHIVIIISTIISLAYFYNNAVKLLYKIETSDPDYSNADAVMRIHTDYVFDLDRTISNE